MSSRSRLIIFDFLILYGIETYIIHEHTFLYYLIIIHLNKFNTMKDCLISSSSNQLFSNKTDAHIK